MSDCLRGVSDRLAFVGELGFERETFGRGAGEEAVDFQRGFGAKCIDGTDQNVVDPGGGNDTQSDFAIDAAEGEVVDHVAERRNVGALGRVKLDDEDVVAAGV